ncbi:hypothetical protein BJY16_006538 [Actinoplanes octamycinicus]|uniref:ARG and Rhodanese-Phosphatase-superfamily-associated domain-containing protein n=1 Tax=Actinoplanes octamycinicus TaxID=135948 RepID=A0A7W7H338_9ACTN|nr:hypothetical protein [Actinoplanes octamycinicus]MBB4743079.1 hypothetical protein [Actinoplanes octamycinicus]GIE61359.1 hypothetical protein Aoc01nite_67610 [Actinoplanes octamycinicus]
MIDLAGLSTGPAQPWGAIRLVPLLRAEPIVDLRLHARLYGSEELSIVEVRPRTAYVAYVPHAFVATWTTDASPAAAYGTQLREPAGGAEPEGIRLAFRRRMARREDRLRLRFLPLHLALEGYLALHFGGPPIAWQEWTRQAVTRGLSPRIETSYAGSAVSGLDDALRIFEIHPDQCGMLLYVGGDLAAAFVVPHPDDYRALHPTLLQDFYGELLYQNAFWSPAVVEAPVRLDDTGIGDLGELRARVARARAEGAAAGPLLDGQRLTVSRVQRMGRFTLSRFRPAFDPAAENHIGELITDRGGRVAYLKTFRLSAAQTRRGHLLSRLAAHDWQLDAAAADLGTNREGLALRLDKAGFGHLLRPDIVDAARHRARTGG